MECTIYTVYMQVQRTVAEKDIFFSETTKKKSAYNNPPKVMLCLLYLKIFSLVLGKVFPTEELS
jgi:hypothetical protein